MYVREAWQSKCGDISPEHTACIRYREGYDMMDGLMRWRPSIHMPRWASRIDLRVTDVRVERLQEISPDDCLAEGLDKNTGGAYPWHTYASDEFASLWDILNKLRGFGWDANPFVWVATFEVLP